MFWKSHFLDPLSIYSNIKKIDIKFRITISILMDRKYPNALAYIKIEAVIWVKQKLWAVKFWAKMIWKQPSFFGIQKFGSRFLQWKSDVAFVAPWPSEEKQKWFITNMNLNSRGVSICSKLGPQIVVHNTANLARYVMATDYHCNIIYI